MKRIIIFLNLFLICCIANSAIKIDLSPKAVSLGETVRLTLVIDSATKTGSPNLMPLLKDFEILSTERSFAFSDINGSMSSTAQWTLILKPKHTGKINIPPITIGNEHSDPAVVNVAGSTNDKLQDSKPGESKYTMITAEVNELNPFINQQIIYTVKLYNRQQLFDAQYQPPEVENALVVPLGEGKHYQDAHQGEYYNIEELSYAIFPQKPGKFKIKPPEFTAEVIDGFNPTRLRISTKAIDLDVKPLAADTNINDWLAAESVELSESYENTHTTYMAGDTIVRHIKLQATGMVAQLVPTLHFESHNNYNVYANKPQIENNLINGKIIASATYKVTYLLTKANDTQIPAIKVTWYDINSKTSREATLPAKNIYVTPSSTSKVRAAPPAAQKPKVQKSQVWNIPLLGFVLAMITLISVCIIKIRRKQIKKLSISPTLNSIQKACMRNDPLATRQAILAFACQQWPNSKILNLNDIPITDSGFKAEVTILTQTIYGKNNNTWSGIKLWKIISKLKFTKSRKKTKTNLPPIYLH